MYNSYSILMSVYYKENPKYFETSIQSMLDQTVKSNDFVIVCDGPLSCDLNRVLDKFSKLVNYIHIVRLEKNSGLGNALNVGLDYCKNELVARMDSDDISLFERCEKQLAIFNQHPELSIVGGSITEFSQTPDNIQGKRMTPRTSDEIISFSRRRNPFNHPSVMFKKNAIKNVGGYREKYHLFEDYDLWIRLLRYGYTGYNLQETLVYMRSDLKMYERRGGLAYAKEMWRFHKYLHEIEWTSYVDLYVFALMHLFVCLCPSKSRRVVYQLLRSQGGYDV